MRMKGIFIVICILLLIGSGAVAQEKMKMDEYKAKLAESQTSEQEANAKLAQLNQEIADLKSQIDDTQRQIDGEWAAVYSALGVTQGDVNAYRDELKGIDSEIDGLAGLSPEELFRRQGEIKAIEERIAKAKESKIGYLSEMENSLAALEGKLAALKAKVPTNIYDQYAVVKGDHLWGIAGKKEIYENPYQWIRIYNTNKDQIKDPDLIYAEQIFNIPRGVALNEYLVAKGDYLQKIAGAVQVLGDPTKWTKLYEANKDIIENPNLIYPYQVLTIPNK